MTGAVDGGTDEIDEGPAGSRRTPLLGVGPLRMDVESGVYGTVVLMTVLAVALDDGIEDFAEAAQVILGPLVATFAAHLFASTLAVMSRRGAPPRGSDLAHATAHAAQYLVLAVVPLLIVVGGATTDAYTPETAVDLVLWLGWVALVVIGAVGGRRAGGGRWWAALAGGLGAAVVGLVVLVLRVLLEHG